MAGLYLVCATGYTDNVLDKNNHLIPEMKDFIRDRPELICIYGSKEPLYYANGDNIDNIDEIEHIMGKPPRHSLIFKIRDIQDAFNMATYLVYRGGLYCHVGPTYSYKKYVKFGKKVIYLEFDCESG